MTSRGRGGLIRAVVFPCLLQCRVIGRFKPAIGGGERIGQIKIFECMGAKEGHAASAGRASISCSKLLNKTALADSTNNRKQWKDVCRPALACSRRCRALRRKHHVGPIPPTQRSFRQVYCVPRVTSSHFPSDEWGGKLSGTSDSLAAFMSLSQDRRKRGDSHAFLSRRPGERAEERHGGQAGQKKVQNNKRWGFHVEDGNSFFTRHRVRTKKR